MLGTAYWPLWGILFAVIGANLLFRLLVTLAVRRSLSPMQLAVLTTSLYVALVAVAVGLGLYWLLTTDLASLASPTVALSSLFVVVIVVWAVISFLRDGRWIWYARASTLLRTRRYAEALAAAEHTLSRSPNFVQAWYLKALALLALDRPAAALDAEGRTLALMADGGSTKQLVQRTSVLASKAFALVTLHRDAEALAACDEVLALAPDNTTAWAYKADVLQRMGHLDEALAAALHVVDDDTGRISAEMQGYTLATMATAFNGLGRFQEALAVAERGVILHPYPARCWLAQAVALAGLGRSEEARVAAEQGLTINEGLLAARPNNTSVWDVRAALLYQLGREPEAEDAEARARALLV